MTQPLQPFPLASDYVERESADDALQALASKRVPSAGGCDEDEDPFPLVRLKGGAVLALIVALASGCSPADGRFLTLEREEVHGATRVCLYEDAIGAEVLTVDAGAVCPPYLEIGE